MEISNRKSKIIIAVTCSIAGLALLGTIVYFVAFRHGYDLFAIIGSLFAKTTNEDRPFPEEGLFTYLNESDSEIGIFKMDIFIEDYQKNKDYNVVFTNSKKLKYGINLDIQMKDGNNEIKTVKYSQRKKHLTGQNRHTYNYYFSLQITDKSYVFKLRSNGKYSLIFAFDKPVSTNFIFLENQLYPQS